MVALLNLTMEEIRKTNTSWSNSIYALILVTIMTVLANSLHAQEIPQQEAAQERLTQQEDLLSLPRLNESSFYQRIDRKTQKILKDMGGQFTAPERNLLEQTRVSVLKFLKEQNPFAHVKELFLKHGLGVGVTAAVTEFTTIIVLPAIFTSAGLPELAVMSAASPSFLATVPGFLAIKTLRVKRKLAQKLGIKNIGQLDRLRNSILGYSHKTRLLSVIIARSKREMEVHVIKRNFARFRSSPMGNIVDLNELKNIVSQFEGKQVVSLIKDASHEDDALFAHLLLKQIQRKPESFSEFYNMIKSRVTDLPVSEHQMTQILLTHEKLQTIAQRREKIRALQSELKGLAQNKQQKDIVKAWKNSLDIDLQNLDFDIMRFEYNLLSTIHAQGNIENLDLTAPHHAVVERMKEIRQHLEKVESWIQEEDGAEKIFMRLNEFNKFWVPLQTRLTPRGDCYGWMRSILKEMGSL
jgi:hypothetical protein